MTNFSSQKKHRTIVISHEAWNAAADQADLIGMSMTALCEHLIHTYLMLEHQPVHLIPQLDITAKRTIYLHDQHWETIKQVKILQQRSISQIIEQLLRAYLGLAIGPELIAFPYRPSERFVHYS